METQNVDSVPVKIPCKECQAGQMHRKFLTYFTWIGDELITVPDFPAWVCDVCGRRDYDTRAMHRLSLLLIPEAGRPAQRSRKIHRKPERKTQRPGKTN